jgi:hypothetical protein
MRIVFYGSNGAEAKAHTHNLRTNPEGKISCQLRHAQEVRDAEKADEIEFMPDVSDYDRERITALYAETETKIVGGESEAGSDDGSKFKVVQAKNEKFYVKEGRKAAAGPFDTEAEAEAAKAELDKPKE